MAGETMKDEKEEIAKRDKAIIELIRSGQFISDILDSWTPKETKAQRQWRKAVREALSFPGVKIT